jgi:Na+-translocating ferredoxin:NAD+ oxidoreductase subunit D
MSEQTPLSPNRLWVTSAPHVHDGDSVARIMWDVNLALVPALLMALWVFGLRGAVVIALSILGAAVGEAVAQKLFLKQPVTLCDGSAVLTGLLLAFCVPAALPWWAAFIGGFVAIIFGKQVYGGLGQNIFNPAHVARAVLLASWPVAMTTWVKPGVATGVIGALPDGVTGATALGLAKETLRNPELVERLTASGTTVLQHTLTSLNLTWSDLLLGSMPGSLGETSKLALLLGGLFLLVRGHISWHVPVTMMGTVFVGSWLYFGDLPMACFHLLTGGLFIGALFMATDMVTSPLTQKGHLIFGLGCGLITLLIRLKGGYPEGVCYSILIMNAFVPLIDRFTVPEKFGRLPATLQEAKA